MTLQEQIKELIWKHFGPAPEYAIYAMDDCTICGRPMRPNERVEGYITCLAKDIEKLIEAEHKRITEALPQYKNVKELPEDLCDYNGSDQLELGEERGESRGFNKCLDQVRSIINPK